MVLEIRPENFYSIKDAVPLDFRAANISTATAKTPSANVIGLFHAGSSARFLFTSHNTNLIGAKRFRRDRILFVNKNVFTIHGFAFITLNNFIYYDNRTLYVKQFILCFTSVSNGDNVHDCVVDLSVIIGALLGFTWYYYWYLCLVIIVD